MQSKMQHVLKREPCYKCQLPVFLAERVVHGARLYHRTCLRCARCESQLTPGNFYETELDDEFCCETCPDEDSVASGSRETIESESRKSFSNKLALFQSKTAAAAVEESGKGLLAKSLSDEEKSKSLKRLTAMYSMQSDVDYKSGTGMSQFMSTQLEKVENERDDHQIVESEDDDDDTDGDDEEEEPPQLPTAKPPVAINPEMQTDSTAARPLSAIKPLIAAKPSTIAIHTASTSSEVQDKPIETDESPGHSLIVAKEELVLNASDDLKKDKQVDSDTTSDPTTVTRLIGVRERLHTFQQSSDDTTEERSPSISKKLFDDPVPHDPVVPVAETLDIADVLEPAEDHQEATDLEHFKEIALRQAIEEINEKVHENESERSASTPEPLPPVVPTPRKRTPKIVVDLEKPEAKTRTTIPAPSNEETEPVVQPKQVVQAKESYPLEYNPFGDNDDEEEEEEEQQLIDEKASVAEIPEKPRSSNPFDSSDDEVELEKDNAVDSKNTVDVKSTAVSHSLNPFGSDEDDDVDDPSEVKRTPVPTPRKITPEFSSLHSTPEPIPRASHRTPQSLNKSIGYSENASPLNLNHSRHYYGSTTSLASTTSTLSAYTRRHKSRAPLPPPSSATKLDVVTASQPNSPSVSARSSPCGSNRNTPVLGRKKRPAPPPPPSAVKTPIEEIDEPVAENSRLTQESPTSRPDTPPPDYNKEAPAPNVVRKLIPIDESLFDSNDNDNNHTTSGNHTLAAAPPEIVYRRTIMPLDISNSPCSPAAIPNDTHDRQWQKVKENKESLNKNRQSQGSMSPDSADLKSPPPSTNDTSIYSNKSTHGKWKRRKGPAPSLPAVVGGAASGNQRGALQMLPLQDIRYELEVIEVQQQGLEKQGIQLEKMIRERCEGGDVVKPIEELANTPNTKDVEDLILQLFEIVNEKNELFRRQAELMYLRRLHRLEQEQAQIDFDIRMLMAQPESNKTDSDKAREDMLIARKVEIVLQRNEVIDCLDADRLREAEEDQSIKLRLELHNARRAVNAEDEDPTAPTKLSKKEKKKLRETKKLAKQKKMDADKDADESEIKAVADAMTKKKKRKFLF